MISPVVSDGDTSLYSRDFQSPVFSSRLSSARVLLSGSGVFGAVPCLLISGVYIMSVRSTLLYTDASPELWSTPQE
ncbi:hypothetical protein BJX70DRAFT_337454 [Aspergillus crustosus]